VVIARPDGTVATIEQPGQPQRRTSMPMRELRECLSEELRRLDPDEVFEETLIRGLKQVTTRTAA
jgi:glucose-6-phosphate dehydrogenase assembly protein OpcA